jgi:serine/threonine protein kinase
VTGRPPFRGSFREILRQHLRRNPPDPRVLCPSLGDATADLIGRLLEKDPDLRPSGPGAVVQEIHGIEHRAGSREIDAEPDLPGRLLSRRRGTTAQRRGSG